MRERIEKQREGGMEEGGASATQNDKACMYIYNNTGTCIINTVFILHGHTDFKWGTYM